MRGPGELVCRPQWSSDTLYDAKMGPEQSGIPLISDHNGSAGETVGSVSVTIGTSPSAEKGMLSEGSLDNDNTQVSDHRKRHGMKVTFRVGRRFYDCWDAQTV